MEMSNDRTIPAPPDKVWAALNDPAILKDSLPGCESLERVDDTTYKATMAAKVGPVSARFNGTMRITDSTPPSGYTLRFEGQGGVAGFANGEAQVKLAPADGNATLLHYDVKAQVGGKIAQIGSRLIDAAAAKLADDFFARFSERLAPPAAVEETGEVVTVGAGRAPASAPWIRWVSLAIIAAIVAYLALRGWK
ncbi:MAG: carbon monoxide dehydrogenase subunit G [Burkholderiales bacterium]|nr:carbon monoxide dehydrogenase subunit G [Burkholderiales bacterium]